MASSRCFVGPIGSASSDHDVSGDDVLANEVIDDDDVGVVIDAAGWNERCTAEIDFVGDGKADETEKNLGNDTEAADVIEKMR